ncbi:hypothetical protein VFPFJ_07747 [Purpureocillium lilacinum]|uniref:Uncharacterized protein n=1 Tax=Purpureocillium lilacinum TaxID=33203 RepID=A0A179H6G8_PURLI|nr:hypothetical protein VFPFJ_07747 [Purpureocillium lilacinum]OAQ85358.1 hypothetical protein VFPFJ_07747 [Purpureocillium lilacinum]
MSQKGEQGERANQASPQPSGGQPHTPGRLVGIGVGQAEERRDGVAGSVTQESERRRRRQSRLGGRARKVYQGGGESVAFASFCKHRNKSN